MLFAVRTQKAFHANTLGALRSSSRSKYLSKFGTPEHNRANWIIGKKSAVCGVIEDFADVNIRHITQYGPISSAKHPPQDVPFNLRKSWNHNMMVEDA